MNNETNISFKSLQDFSVEPPNILFGEIMSIIEEEHRYIDSSLKSLSNFESIIPTDTPNFDIILNKIKQTDALNNFKPLKDFEVTPIISFEKLMELLKGYISLNNPKAKVVAITNLKKIASIAAILLIGLIAFFSWTKTGVKFKNNVAYEETLSTKNIIANNNDKISTDTALLISKKIEQSLSSKKLLQKKNGLALNIPSKKTVKNSDNNYSLAKALPKDASIKIGDTTFNILDNDFIATFASFNETNLPAFLKADNPIATTISIDKYSDITISENMAAMMKKMYKTKKNGNPTRRARKTREKLEKWKKIDDEYFDTNNNSNPLNPIDLGDFILHK